MPIKYSVLMSVYNQEKAERLRISIDSMINQTSPPDQFVIVADGPLTEGLDNVISEFQAKNNIFTIVRLAENHGLGYALNKGLGHCVNELVARMDSDDISLPDRCKKQLELFDQNPNLSICSGTIDEFVSDPTNIVSSRVVPEKQADIKKRTRTRSAFNHPAVMFKKSEVLRCGGYGELRRKEDQDLFSRMMNNGCIAYNIQAPLLLFRSDADNLKRRKSWVNCKNYIIMQWGILSRKECSYLDFLYVLCAQVFFFISPAFIVRNVSNQFLRKTNKRSFYRQDT